MSTARRARGYVEVPRDVRARVAEVCVRYPANRDACRELGISVEVLRDLSAPNGLVRSDVLERVKKKLVLLAAAPAAVLVFALASCQSPEARFAADVATCDLAPTCAEAVQCRRDAAIRAGRDPDKTVGHCEKDAP